MQSVWLAEYSVEERILWGNFFLEHLSVAVSVAVSVVVLLSAELKRYL